MVNTFLPYWSFEKSAEVLDNKRLGKQRVENLQIMSALVLGTPFARNHPVTEMWRGHEWALMEYQKAIVHEWVSRGYKDTCLEKTQDLYDRKRRADDKDRYPWWFGNTALHEGYKSILMRKKPEHYGRYFGKDFSQHLPFVYPTAEEPSAIDHHPALSTGS